MRVFEAKLERNGKCMLSGVRVSKAQGGKVRKIFLYQKNILFASKKTHSCRNT
ncbi:hypothetical protein [Leptospira interrogans]|uniref:hypothetical protein n=1 Tax=Leptospira interrogans TaxID=173 RepID=UPI0018DED494|nr:hypothetical protein [Leptospira interrogans]